LDLPTQPSSSPRISPDGKQLAVHIDDGKASNISIYDLRGAGPVRRLTFGGRDMYPYGRRTEGASPFSRIEKVTAAFFGNGRMGTGPAERLAKPDSLTSELRPDAWSPEGRTLTLSVTPPLDYRLFTLTAEGALALRLFRRFRHAPRPSRPMEDGSRMPRIRLAIAPRYSSSRFHPPARNSRFQRRRPLPVVVARPEAAVSITPI